MTYVPIQEFLQFIGGVDVDSALVTACKINNIRCDVVLTVKSINLKSDVDEYIQINGWNSDEITMVHTPLEKEYVKILIIKSSWKDLYASLTRISKLKAFL
jgi:hypothetical protein